MNSVKNLLRGNVRQYGMVIALVAIVVLFQVCLLYTSPSPRDRQKSRMPSSA